MNPELVLDFHTTTAEQPDLLITADREDEVTRDFINASTTENVLIVEPLNDITTVAPHFAAYEVSNSHLNDDLYARICADIKRYLDGEAVDLERNFYRMTGKTSSEEAQANTNLENFVYNDNLQAIPSFLGGCRIDAIQM